MAVQMNTGGEEQTLKQAFETLNQAAPYAKDMYQNHFFQTAKKMAEKEEGIRKLYEYAPRFNEAGVFEGGPWEEPSKLQPALVNGSLRSDGVESIVALLSELRMVALAREKHTHPEVSASDAKKYLHEVMANNLDFIFPEETEDPAEQEQQGKETERAQRLFALMVEELSLQSISSTLIDEIKRLMVQRPIMTERVRLMIRKAEQLLHEDVDEQDRKAIETFHNAISTVTERAKRCESISEYRNSLQDLDNEELSKEAAAFGESMRETGLVSGYHVALIRHLNRNGDIKILQEAMGLSSKGSSNLKEHYETVQELIKVSIHLPTRQSLYGLARMLERGVLSQPPVLPGLRRLIELDIKQDVRKTLMEASDSEQEGLTAGDVLTAGVISVLGQPLGIGQGLNPTCQSARALSLWSIHDPGYLLELIPRAARDGDIDMGFEGQTIHSKDLPGGLAPELHKELDPVSLVLVPHLDRIYADMVRRVQFRGDDPHKWVNPAFYGDWIAKAFSKVFQHNTQNVIDYQGFVRLFYATHHRDYNEGHEMIYPNPVGICVTTVYGNFLGFHAITIQRIADDPDDTYRVYFYNPNNDSSQNWGQGIEPSVRGHGEKEGESSLPFHEFVSRLYAFHYNPYEQGDSFAVEKEVVEKIEQLAKESWGRNFQWV
ncbi:hypothetical protein [Salibacterium qingdaonense]|uniref:Uncharacterized protein n=1 Tax=Salibacterium qingdaonense TaxID=266892 RepID=A0A1I4IQ06_9BACI|nr:hypothetical protein [Salibacterium qingdaonense]SFL55846.1 hypothetical protein SAMN04488054_102142 [Salibacterium qingdaonense]